MKKLAALFFIALVAILLSDALHAQQPINVPGYDYVRYGEKIGLLSNRFIAFVPSNYDSTQTYRILWWQHGAGGNAEQVASFMNYLAGHNLTNTIVISTDQFIGEWRYVGHGLESTRQVFNHLHKIRRDYNTYEKAVLCGFSMGGQFTAHWGLTYPDEIIMASPSGFGGGFRLPDGSPYWDGNLTTQNNFNFAPMYWPYASAPADSGFKHLVWLNMCGTADQPNRVWGSKKFNQHLANNYTLAAIDSLWPNVGHDFSNEMKGKIVSIMNQHISNTNKPPNTQISFTHAGGTTVTMDATASTDPDGSVVRYRWFIDGQHASRAAVFTHTFAQPGTYLVRAYATDNNNDRTTLYRNVRITNSGVQVNTPPVTYAINKTVPFNTDFDFAPTDFTPAITDAENDPITQIKINSQPLKGELLYHGQPVTLGQQLTLAQTQYLSYRPLAGNIGEDFFEYNAHDGFGWSAFNDSRVTITIQPAQPVLFDSVYSTTSNQSNPPKIAVGLDSGSLYFVNEQSALTQVPANLKGAEFLRLNSQDKNETGNNTLYFYLNKPADVFIAQDGRATTPPNWITQNYTLENNNTLKSWFYFNLYKKTYTAPGWYSMGGNAANGAVNTKSMYFVIGLPAGNNKAPQAQDVSFATTAQQPYALGSGLFAAAYTDFENDPLTGVYIQTLPLNGTLALNGVPATVGDTIATANLPLLTYTPNSNYQGNDYFRFKVFDGNQLSNSSRKVNATVGAATALPPTLTHNIDLWPNPAQNLLNIKATNTGTLQALQLINTNGQVVAHSNLNQHNTQQAQLWLHNLPSGIYMLRIKCAQSVVVKKVLIAK